MRLFGTIVTAFSMFSRIPVPHLSWDDRNMRYMLCAFPLVGAAAGVLLCSWCWLAGTLRFGGLLTSTGYVLLPLVVTGGIHLDCFCDTVDALSSHAPQAKKLEILKDPHTGAFAVIVVAAYFLFYLALCSELEKDLKTALLISGGYLLERMLSGLSVLTFPKARKDGLAKTFSDHSPQSGGKTFLLMFLGLLTAAMVVFSPIRGSALCAAAGLAFWYYHHMSLKQFGGITGDLAGYFLQVCEISMLTALIVTQKLDGVIAWFW